MLRRVISACECGGNNIMGLKGKKLPMPTREKLCELYQTANKTPFQIGQEFKVSANTEFCWKIVYEIRRLNN